MENESDLDRLKQNLIDANCDQKFIDRFLILIKERKAKEQFRLLSCHRYTLLHGVHEKQKQVDYLDYLIYQLKKAMKSGKNDTEEEE